MLGSGICPVNVLLTHLQLRWPGGSESYTEAVVGALAGAGHPVTVYTPVAGPAATRVRDAGGRVVDELGALTGEHFDLVHAQHNAPAVQARSWFPQLPMLFHCHGTQPWPEQPPPGDIGIARYLAVSELVERHLIGRGVPGDRIRVLHNPVDTRRFSPGPPLRDPPRRALVLSNRMDAGTLRVIREGCARLGIEVEDRGAPGRRVWNVEDLLHRADIVFSLGRGALEAMACARAVFVYDVHGADGWVTPASVRELESHTFSGKRFGRRLTPDDLVAVLRRYAPEMGPANRTLALERYDIRDYLPRLVKLYEETIDRHRPPPVRLRRFDLMDAFRSLPERFGDHESREQWLAHILDARRSVR